MAKPKYSKLLIDESPLQVLPSLACLIGLNEALFLQQLHYWLGEANRTGNGRHDQGRMWIFNSYHRWQIKNFPFWSLNTVRRTIERLISRGLVLCVEPSEDGPLDGSALWYTIDYDALNALREPVEDGQPAPAQDQPPAAEPSPVEEEAPSEGAQNEHSYAQIGQGYAQNGHRVVPKMSTEGAQNEQGTMPKMGMGGAQNGQGLLRDYSETPQRTNREGYPPPRARAKPIDHQRVWSAVSQKLKTQLGNNNWTQLVVPLRVVGWEQDDLVVEAPPELVPYWQERGRNRTVAQLVGAQAGRITGLQVRSAAA